jgi:hypothetical protein
MQIGHHESCGITHSPKCSHRHYVEAVTLNPEEVRDAGADGVDIGGLPDGGTCGFAKVDGRWLIAMNRTAFASGLRSTKDDVFPADEVACAALDRVREYWRRRALAEFAAAKVADLLSTALTAAREHARLFAAIADDGVLPIDRAQKFRADAADLAHPIREIERLMNSYKVHGDVP